ncbi:hypothetical protein HZA97_04150 [Candidatus Woesearchaeota archaeon]|nr:hypothetical protein [Candidatus Woesearchaeota archaeon]
MNTRKSKRTLEQLEKIKEISNPYFALVEIIKLYEKFPSHEMNVPVEYDPKTGKPVKYDWQEVSLFRSGYNGKNAIYLFNNLSVHYFELQKNVEVFLKELYPQCPLTISTQNGTYILNQLEGSTSPDHIEPVGISFDKLEKELTTEGIRSLEETVEEQERNN